MRHVHGWRRALRWVQAFFAIVLSLVIVVIAVASLILKTQWGRGLVRRQVEARLNDTFVGGATLGDIRGNALSELELDDLVINGPDMKPAIAIKKLKVKLPLMPLISHQLRVDEVIAEDVDVVLKKQQTGGYQIAYLMKPGPKSTWNVELPNIQVHRGHVKMDTGSEWIDLDNLELYVDSKMPFAGPIDASVSLAASYRQKQAPIALGAVVHVGTDAVDVRSALVSVGKVAVAVTGGRIPKGDAAKAYGGTVVVAAPAAEVERLVPQVKLPADVALAIEATPSGTFTDLTIDGMVGKAPVLAVVHGDIAAKAGRGFVLSSGLDLGALTHGKLRGNGGALVAFEVDASKQDAQHLPLANAMVTTWGNIQDSPNTKAVVALSTTTDHIRAALGATSSDGLHAAVGASVFRNGNAITLERGVVIAATRDPSALTNGKAPVHGSLDANISAAGELSPHPDLAIAGHVNSDRLRYNDLIVDHVRMNIDAREIPAKPVGTARLEIDRLNKQDIQLDKIILAAGNRPDGKLQVSLRTDPKANARYRADLDALVTPGETIGIDLQRHIIRPGRGGLWEGKNAHITVGPEQIEVRNLTSQSSDGKLAVNATLGRKTGAIDAKVDGNLKLSSVDPKMKGDAVGHVAVQRARGEFSGDVTAEVHGFTEDPRSADPVDSTLKISAHGGKLVANVDAHSMRIGDAKIDVDVDGPRDMGDAAAWKKLTRTAVKDLHIQLTKLDINRLGRTLGRPDASLGTVNGDIRITPAGATGSIEVRGVRASMRDVGVIDADVKLAQTGPNELATSAQARLGTYGTLDANAKLGMPARLFDPAAWKALGPGAIHGASIKSSEVSFTPGTLERFGIVSQFRGVASIKADIKPGLAGANVALDLHDFDGGRIVSPIAAHVDATYDTRELTTTGTVKNNGATLIELTSKIPMTVAQLRADPKSLKEAPLHATLEIPNVPAKNLMAVLGNTQLTGGSIDGKLEISGTVAKPTAKAHFVASKITVPAEGTHPAQAINELAIDGTYDGATANIRLTGDETGGGKLDLQATATLADMKNAKATLVASNLDLAPIVPMLPGPAGGLGGHLDANLQIVGTDPATAQLGGELKLREGQIPIAPVVGTLFHGALDVSIKDHKLKVALRGKLGKGDILLDADAPLDGFAPSGGTAKLTLRKVQLIGTTEPIINAVVDAKLARKDNKWTATLNIDRGNVVIPDTKGEQLKPVGVPPDVEYKNGGKHVQPPSQVAGDGATPHRAPPEAPIFEADLHVTNTHVESTEVRGYVNAKLHVTMDNHEMAVVGGVWLTGGDLDLFDRRYQVDRAALHFDGSLDPVLDVRILHDFPDITTITEVHGRMSKPELVLSSSPNTFSQAELLGFLLGGEPSGDPNAAPSARDKVTGAGASFLANQIGGQVKKALPVDIDVLKYESASATSSAAVKVGTWITHTLFFGYREHINARPDENTGEGELEYWIRRRLMLQTTIGDRGYDGADLLWRRRW